MLPYFGALLLMSCGGSPGQGPSPQPVARLSGPMQAFVRQPLILDASTSTGRITRYVFDFGDGSPAVTQRDPFAFHSYSRLGVFAASVTVVNSAEVMSTATAPIEVVGHAPTAFLAAPEPDLKLTPLTLDASGSSDSDGKIVSYVFDFGDGAAPVEQPEPIAHHADATVALPEYGAMSPQDVALGLAGGLHLAFAWWGPHGSEIAYLRSPDRGLTFPTPVLLSPGDGVPSLMPAIDTDGLRGVFVTWYDWPDVGRQSVLFTRSTDSGDTFSTPVILAGGVSSNANYPTVAWAGAGQVVAAWVEGTERPRDVFVARSTDSGTTFSAPFMLSAPGEFSAVPQLLSDHKGTLVAVWEQVSLSIETGSILVARSRDFGASWERAQSIASVSPQYDLSGIRAALGDEGQLYVVYCTLSVARFAPPEFTSFLVVSPDAGATFSNPLPLALVNSQKGDCPFVAARSNGRIGLVWAVGPSDVVTKDISFSTGVVTP